MVDQKHYGFEDSYFDDIRVQQRNMWTLTKFYFALTFLAVIYCLISWIQSVNNEGRCDIITTNVEVDNFLWLLFNINSLMLWQFRMMYVFWPAKPKKETKEDVRQESFVFSDNTTSMISDSNYAYDFTGQ